MLCCINYYEVYYSKKMGYHISELKILAKIHLGMIYAHMVDFYGPGHMYYVCISSAHFKHC